MHKVRCNNTQYIILISVNAIQLDIIRVLYDAVMFFFSKLLFENIHIELDVGARSINFSIKLEINRKT